MLSNVKTKQFIHVLILDNDLKMRQRWGSIAKSETSIMTVIGPANVQLKISANAKLVNKIQRMDVGLASEYFCLGSIMSKTVLAIVPITHKKIKVAEDKMTLILLKLAGSYFEDGIESLGDMVSLTNRCVLKIDEDIVAMLNYISRLLAKI